MNRLILRNPLPLFIRFSCQRAKDHFNNNNISKFHSTNGRVRSTNRSLPLPPNSYQVPVYSVRGRGAILRNIFINFLGGHSDRFPQDAYLSPSFHGYLNRYLQTELYQMPTNIWMYPLLSQQIAIIWLLTVPDWQSPWCHKPFSGLLRHKTTLQKYE